MSENLDHLLAASHFVQRRHALLFGVARWGEDDDESFDEQKKGNEYKEVENPSLLGLDDEDEITEEVDELGLCDCCC